MGNWRIPKSFDKCAAVHKQSGKEQNRDENIILRKRNWVEASNTKKRDGEDEMIQPTKVRGRLKGVMRDDVQ